MLYRLNDSVELRQQFASTLKDENGHIVEVTGASAKFHVAKLNSSSVITDAPATVTNGSAGTVEHAWSASDTRSIVNFRGEFEVTFPAGLIETYPNSGYISIQITYNIT